ncbi:unnamed protein product, partial [Musa textilis]
ELVQRIKIVILKPILQKDKFVGRFRFDKRVLERNCLSKGNSKELSNLQLSNKMIQKCKHSYIHEHNDI